MDAQRQTFQKATRTQSKPKKHKIILGHRQKHEGTLVYTHTNTHSKTHKHTRNIYIQTYLNIYI